MKILRIGSSLNEPFTYLKNVDDVRQFIDYVGDEKISIGDLSLLSKEAIAALLKFIEERTTDIFCYASRDNISQILISRFDKVEWLEKIIIGRDAFEAFIQSVNTKENINAIEREFVKNSAEWLNSFLIYRRLSKGVTSRIGELL